MYGIERGLGTSLSGGGEISVIEALGKLLL